MNNPNSHKADESEVRPSPIKNYIRLFLKWLGQLLAGFIILSLFIVLSLRWINPPTSSFMLQRRWHAWWNDEEQFQLRYDWVDRENITWKVKIAAITSEDQRFADHWGIDFKQVKKAIEESKRGEDLRGASTITQQTAKNMFLWPAQSYIRKGLEAYFAFLLELCWPKTRILEVYLNIAEFGDGIYGVESAGKYYFNTTAANLSKAQSALMVTALPSPKRYNLAAPSNYMIRRQQWNLRYMDYLGNQSYLERLN